MPASPAVAHIEPEVLQWARESAGYSLREAADKIRVEKWYLELVEAGGDLLTLREAERAADVYQRPLASLFLPTPPAEEPQEVQFRRLPGTPRPPWGPAVQLTARKVTERQQAALEIYEDLEEAPPWIPMSERFVSLPREALARVVRETLGIAREDPANWKQDAYAPFREWREAVEKLGVLVMQDGPVAVRQMRGFASIEPREVPAILVNNKDDPRARAFTILHELGHVILARRGELVGPETERWCESFAGEVLMPTDWLAEELERSLSTSTLQRVEDVARAFRVTPLAAAVRVAHEGLVPRDEAGAVIGEIQRRWKGGSRGQGDRSSSPP
jgi:Zn-dependent peptidase ImmA (M78 family)